VNAEHLLENYFQRVTNQLILVVLAVYLQEKEGRAALNQTEYFLYVVKKLGNFFVLR